MGLKLRPLRRTWKTSLTAFGAVVAVVIASASPTQAAGTAAGEQASEKIATAPEVGTNAAVSGVVTKNGKAAAGALVVAEVQPNSAILEAMPAGEETDSIVVGVATSTLNGEFALELDPASIPSTHVEAIGAVNLDLIVGDSEAHVRYSVSVTPGQQRNSGGMAWVSPRVDEALLAERAGSNKAPVHLAVEIGNDAWVVEDGNEPNRWILPERDGEIPSEQSLRSLDESEAKDQARVHRFLGPVPVVQESSISAVGQTQKAAALVCAEVATDQYRYGVTEEFVRSVGVIQARPHVHLEVGSSHTMGVAIERDGWSASGSATQGTSSSNDGQKTLSGIVQNKVNYRKYTTVCGGLVDHHKWKPVGFHSLLTGTVSIARPNWNTIPDACTSVNSTDNPIKTRGGNATFAGGVRLGNINLSAKAEFSGTTKIRWVMSGNAKLCGSSSRGWASAPEAAAYIR